VVRRHGVRGWDDRVEHGAKLLRNAAAPDTEPLPEEMTVGAERARSRRQGLMIDSGDPETAWWL
jgi:hypothetical protein